MKKKAQVWIASLSRSHEPQVLLFRLVETRGGGWHPVTGGVEPNETLLAGAQRETLEETSIDPSAGLWVDLKYSHQFEGRWGRAEEHAFALILNDAPLAIHLEPSEMVEFKWVTIAEAKKEVGFEAQRNALEALSCYLRGHGGRSLS